MDNITHSLTGLMLSRAGLNRLTPRAAALLILAANAPDVDVVSGFWGAQSYFHYHRWYTHTLLLIPLMAVLPVLIVRLFTRAPLPWLRAYAVSLIGVASHPLMDFMNPYGIRLLMPFSHEWPSLDITNVVDIWIWAVLFVAVCGPALSRLVSSEIGSRKSSGRGWAIFALSFLVLYTGVRVILKNRAEVVQASRLYDGASPRRVSVMPTAFNPLLWKGVVETDDYFVVQDVALWSDLDPTLGHVYHKGEFSPAMQAAKQERVFQDLMGFSRALLWRASPDPDNEGAVRVNATELRFGFEATALVDSRGVVQQSGFRFNAARQPR